MSTFSVATNLPDHFVSSLLRQVLLKEPVPDVAQMIRVEAGKEAEPSDWPANWRMLLLLDQTIDLIESHEYQIKELVENAIKLRAVFNSDTTSPITQATASASALPPH